MTYLIFRFICNKNYARWRSRDERAAHGQEEFYTEIVQDGAPLCLEAHSAHIEALQTDGHLLVSQCLAGRLVVWDTLTGEIISRISRSVHQAEQRTQNTENTEQSLVDAYSCDNCT